MNTTPVTAAETTAAPAAEVKPAAKAIASKRAKKPAAKNAVKPVKKAASKAPSVKAAKKPVAPKKQTKLAKTSKPTKPAAAPAPQKASAEKAATPKANVKMKLVRDSFTLPEADHDLIKQCKKIAIAAGRETKKSEVVRAAIRAFSTLTSAQQFAAYNALQSIAVGRPKSK